MFLSDEQRERFLPRIVPACLTVIALLQIVLAHTADLSPWKGGGFGMFSVTDAPTMRTVSIECIDSAGAACRVYIDFEGEDSGSEAARQIRRLQSLPTRARLQRLADTLAGSEFVPVTLDRVALERRLEVSLEFLTDWQKEVPLYRLTAGPRSPLSADEPVSLQAVRIQAWRIVFDPGVARLRSEPIGEPVAAGEWP